MKKSIQIEVSYAQLVVFISSLERPFNDWTDQHVDQGFAWRPGSVSFRALTEAGPHDVDISVVKHVGLPADDAVRVIEVPFEVPEGDSVEVGSIGETISLPIQAGIYLLRCEFLLPQDARGNGYARLLFSVKDSPNFTVVRADSDISIEGELLMMAEPA